jgi:replication factor C subunit 3/5
VTVVVINEADSLSRDAQAALRRTMEKYMSNLRIILCANSTSRLIAPIKSRCLLMRVAAPNPDEMLTVLNHVAKRAGAGSFPEDVADQIITDANGNMRKAILVFEAMKMQSYACAINILLCQISLRRLKNLGLTCQARHPSPNLIGRHTATRSPI